LVQLQKHRHRDRSHQSAVPQRRTRAGADILNRINEISFNSSLMREMRAVSFVKYNVDWQFLTFLRDQGRDGTGL
jgi:hypothetical protein